MHICRQTQTLLTHIFARTRTRTCPHTHTHRHHNPLLLPQRRVEQMLRNLRCKRELGLPPQPTHTQTPCAPPFCTPPSHTHTHAPTKPALHSNTHMNFHILHTKLEDTYFLSLHLFLYRMYEWSYTHTYAHVLAQKQTHIHTRLHALWPTSPSRLALLIRGTMWHSIPSGTRHRLCQLCIVLCPLESTRPNDGPSLLLSLSLAFSLFHCLSHLFTAHELR